MHVQQLFNTEGGIPISNIIALTGGHSSDMFSNNRVEEVEEIEEVEEPNKLSSKADYSKMRVNDLRKHAVATLGWDESKAKKSTD